MTLKISCDILLVKLALHFKVVINVKNKLKKLREEKEINQEKLAEILKVSRQTICSLESGKYNPSIILAFKISKFFNKPIEEIFIYEEGID